MKKPVYLLHSSVISSLGTHVVEHIDALKNKQSGLIISDDPCLHDEALPFGKVAEKIFEKHKELSRFDALIKETLLHLLKESKINLSTNDVGILFSTTKGNIELLEKNDINEKIYFSYSAELIKTTLKNENDPIIVSNACISGMSIFILAERLLQEGKYKHMVLVGCDVLTKFVVSGFNSFHALDKNSCKPFDKNRLGINLGEACAACVLSIEHHSPIQILKGFISNDANHISGPSKTGEELAFCIKQSLLQNQVEPHEIDFIAAHGTGTVYNDQMEAKAISINHLSNTPTMSYKAYIGHTLGAAGILEIILSAHCMKEQFIPASLNYQEADNENALAIQQDTEYKKIKYVLKTAAGFGGCNAALILKNTDL
ncbi:MAG: beta-ketoacyl synthase N-terminal-like domain-containing protein [Chitinophagaceae bacterium]